MSDKVKRFMLDMVLALAAVGLVIAPAHATVTPPDLGVCGADNGTCDNLPTMVCSNDGFKITLLNVDPANFNNSGTATYHYQICDAHEGDCPVTINDGKCHGISHFDVVFPGLGDVGSCLSATTLVEHFVNSLQAVSAYFNVKIWASITASATFGPSA